jgi:hypothetical protein
MKDQSRKRAAAETITRFVSEPIAGGQPGLGLLARLRDTRSLRAERGRIG